MKQQRWQYNNYITMDIIANHIKLMCMMIFTYGNSTRNSDNSNYDHECIIAKTEIVRRRIVY